MAVRVPSFLGAAAFLASTLGGGAALTNLGARPLSRDDPHTQTSAASRAHADSYATTTRKLPFKLRFSDEMCGLLDGKASQQKYMTQQRQDMLSQPGSLVAMPGAANTMEQSSRTTLRASRGPKTDAHAWHKKASSILCDLPEEQIKYAKCPPGPYMTDSEREARELRLRKALCLTQHRGWVSGIGNDPNISKLTNDHYTARGYMTYESSSWPKPATCNTVSNDHWRQARPMDAVYRPDFSPINYNKLQCPEYSVEFLKSWKVASMTFPAYLECEYAACGWNEVPVTSGGQSVYKALTAVREPLSRWISAASELLERAVNGYCPSGPCTENDGYISGKGEGSTADKMLHQTTWYQLLKLKRADYSDAELAELVKAMVTDTKCNLFTYASEHLSTQSNFVTQNSGRADNLSFVMKLENADEGLDDLAHFITGSPPSGQCSLVPANVKDCKPGGDKIPAEEDFFNVLQQSDALMQEICLVYAQDFACFDYELPEQCEGLF